MATTQPLASKKMINDPELEELIGLEITHAVEERLTLFQGANLAALTVKDDPDIQYLINEKKRQAVEETGTIMLNDIDDNIQRIFQLKANRAAIEAAQIQQYWAAAQAATAPKTSTNSYPAISIAEVNPGDLIRAASFNQLVRALNSHDARIRIIEGGGKSGESVDINGLRVLNERIKKLEAAIEALLKGGTKPPAETKPDTRIPPAIRSELEKKYNEELRDAKSFREKILEKEEKIEIAVLPKKRENIFDGGNIDPNPENILAEVGLKKGATETEVLIDIPKTEEITKDGVKEIVFGGVLYKDVEVREKEGGGLTVVLDTADGKGTPLNESELLKTGGFELRGAGGNFGAGQPALSDFRMPGGR